ncbi:integrator complex subunit 4-like [Paramacrobiotus metropolitanus]|uniref:integrator complex subunit 4-like n=1 Tax=Paramacrobiotus metropolitanus TaxID=2943436 RepID=UPI0024462CB8|nr:integrator complex subunit 4-like [Paramacrobiotus metropolitanus]
MSAYKKRMLTDYTSTVTHTDVELSGSEENASSSRGRRHIDEEDSLRSPKRLRLNPRSLVLPDIERITDLQKAQAALDDLSTQIHTISENGVSVSVDEIVAVCEKLCDLFHIFHSLHSVILRRMGELLKLSLGTSCFPVLRPFIIKVLNSTSWDTRIRVQLARILLEAGVKHRQNSAFCWHIVTIVDKFLWRNFSLTAPLSSDAHGEDDITDGNIQGDDEMMQRDSGWSVLLASCLDVIGEVLPYRDTSRQYVLSLWNRFAQDGCNEVRAAAYRMLDALTERGFRMRFSLTTYRRLCNDLEDIDSSVRSSVMNLIFRLSDDYPSQQVANAQAVHSSETTETINLVDDVFCKICDRVNDWEINIRAQAASILGRMNGVTLDYILQTVDKKLMSDLRVKVAGHERQKRLFESGEWSSGRKWADDAPKERLQQDDVSLMSIGATGAFVLALEDQFQEVREQAVISMALLAEKHPTFGSTSAEFLVDMFNDEIHDVRLKALQMFPRLGGGVELREDQLEMVLTVLQDATLDIRQGLRSILPTLKYSSAKLIRMVHTELLNNLKQYPSDHGQICQCLAKIGASNGALIAEEATVYLNIHPYLHSSETKSDDKIYIGTMALLCNAASSTPEIVKVFLDFHLRHYLLYRYKYPEWFPYLDTAGNARLKSRKGSLQKYPSADGNIASFLAILERRFVEAKGYRNIADILDVGRKEIQNMVQWNVSQEAAGAWLDLQFRFASRYVEALENSENDMLRENDVNEAGVSKSIVDEMRTLFTGMTDRDRLLTATLILQDKLLQALQSGERSGDLVEVGPEILIDITDLEGMSGKYGEKLPRWISGIGDDLKTMYATKLPYSKLLSWLRSCIPVPRLPGSEIQRVSVNIVSPIENEYVVNVVAGTIHKIPLEAVVEGCLDLAGIVICILLPDGRRLVVYPTAKDTTTESDADGRLKFFIKKDLAVSQSVWSAAAAIIVQLAKTVVGKTLSLLGNGNYQLLQEEDTKKLLYLGKAVTYKVMPQSIRTHL